MRRSVLRPTEVCGPHNIDLSPQPERRILSIYLINVNVSHHSSLLANFKAIGREIICLESLKSLNPAGHSQNVARFKI